MADPKTLTDHSFGIVPYRQTPRGREFLLVQHIAGHWAFPKGHAEADETPPETARRELAEETGLSDIQLVQHPAFEEVYRFTKRSGRVVKKTVTYYLARVPMDAAVTVQPEEIADFRWADESGTATRLTFDEGKSLFDQVIGYLATRPE